MDKITAALKLPTADSSGMEFLQFAIRIFAIYSFLSYIVSKLFGGGGLQVRL